MKDTQLKQKDHDNLDIFLGSVLDYYKDGEVSKERAIGTIAHVMAALERGNYEEARKWFEQGRKLILQTPSYPAETK